MPLPIDGTDAQLAKRIGVVTAEPILAQGLALLLDAEPGLRSETVPADLSGALGLLSDGKVDALIVDEDALRPAGTAAIAATLATTPGAGVVLLASNRHDPSVVTAPSRLRVVDKHSGTGGVVTALRELLLAAQQLPA
jgi:DNA-binding NarL/FixJ family response regulator